MRKTQPLEDRLEENTGKLVYRRNIVRGLKIDDVYENFKGMGITLRPRFEEGNISQILYLQGIAEEENCVIKAYKTRVEIYEILGKQLNKEKYDGLKEKIESIYFLDPLIDGFIFMSSSSIAAFFGGIAGKYVSDIFGLDFLKVPLPLLGGIISWIKCMVYIGSGERNWGNRDYERIRNKKNFCFH